MLVTAFAGKVASLAAHTLYVALKLIASYKGRMGVSISWCSCSRMVDSPYASIWQCVSGFVVNHSLEVQDELVQHQVRNWQPSVEIKTKVRNSSFIAIRCRFHEMFLKHQTMKRQYQVSYA